MKNYSRKFCVKGWRGQREKWCCLWSSGQPSWSNSLLLSETFSGEFTFELCLYLTVLENHNIELSKNLLWKYNWSLNLKCPCESVGLTGVSFSDNKRHTPSRMWPSESQVDRHSGLEGQNFSLFTHYSGPSRLLIKWFCHSVKRTILAIWVEWVSSIYSNQPCHVMS